MITYNYCDTCGAKLIHSNECDGDGILIFNTNDDNNVTEVTIRCIGKHDDKRYKMSKHLTN